MANNTHLGLLKQGVENWNAWREEQKDLKPDLSGADLQEADLPGINLARANLSSANLRGANLRKASLWAANLRLARLDLADLAQADLSFSDLSLASLQKTKVDRTVLVQTVIHSVDLNEVQGTMLGWELARGTGGLLEREPMAEAHHPSLEVKSGHLYTVFHCQHPHCGKASARVEIIRTGVEHPDEKMLMRELMEGKGSGGQIIIYDFLQDYVTIQLGRLRGRLSEEAENNFKQNVSKSLGRETFARIEQLLRAGDAQGLYSLRKDYAPFYCPSCQGVYCPRHWRLEGVWESDSNWFEGWQGICPYGHSCFIDD